MLTLGLDIGTTTISAVVAENGVVLESITKPHDSFLKGRPAWERAQDVSVLRAAALEAVAALTEKYSVTCIGITGQQHGILYLDENGNPIKNLKRHPNIGNHVIIYANATILGGNTYVGDGCIIGASVWLTGSVEAGKTLYYTPNQK